MRYVPEQLEALVAVLDEGTFEAAARRLSITQSAVSQRIKALETHTGRVMVVRSSPCRATPDGEHLVRMARQVQLLSAETTAHLGAAARPTVIAVAVNADSLATWFIDALASLAEQGEVLVQVHVEDQEHSAHLLRAGRVMAAVTSDPLTVQGCSVERLGVMRYTPVATPALLDRHRSTRRARWRQLPVVRFNERDGLQEQVLHAHGVAGHAEVPTHRVPSSEAFAAAVRLGLGWGVLPDQHLGDGLSDGTLVRLPGTRPVDVELYWQRWRLSSRTLDRLGDDVRTAASGALRRRPGGASPRRDARRSESCRVADAN